MSQAHYPSDNNRKIEICPAWEGGLWKVYGKHRRKKINCLSYADFQIFKPCFEFEINLRKLVGFSHFLAIWN